MPFNASLLPIWNAVGSPPPDSKRTVGYLPDEHPPADWWNWQMNLTYKALKDLQDNAADKTLVSTTTAGLMAAADKVKLNGVATNANNYVHPTTHAPSIIVQDANNRFVTDAEKSNWNAKETTSGAQAKADAVKNMLNDQSLLWGGAVYPMSADTITPSKKLSECPNGWILVWSDYDVGVGTNDYQFVFTFVPKTFPGMFPGSTASAYFQIPTFLADTYTVTTIKQLTFTDSTIRGNDINKNGHTAVQSDDAVLRRVLAF